MQPVLSDKGVTLYQDVADKVGHLIESGALRPGERVPSVRTLSRQLKVSISTVVQAYRLLEDRGRIEAKPQSGYYVRGRFWQRSVEPAMSRPAMESTAVNIGELAARVLREGHAPGVVPLGAALHAPDIFPIRQLNRIAAAIGRRSPRAGGSYDVPPGCEALRVQVARRCLDAGCAIAPDEIVTTGGAQEAVGLCLRAVTRPGDTVAIESPTFYGLLQLIEVMGLKALEVPTDPRTGVCLDALGKALDATRVAACLFVNNFNNPLGGCVPDEAKERLVRMLAGRGVPLIEDDIYGDLGFGPQRPKSAKAFDQEGNVLLCSSFSKTLAPGYRVGWCAPGRWRAEVERIKLFTNIATATVPQMAIAEFLGSGGYDHHLRRVRRAFQQQVARMSDAVCEHFPEGTKMTRPAGGFVLWVELDERVDSLRLHEMALAERVSVAPGPIFSASGKYRNFVRLNCEAPWSAEIDGAVRTLGRLVRMMQGEPALAGGSSQVTQPVPGAPSVATARTQKTVQRNSRSHNRVYEGRNRFEHWLVDNQVYFITARCRDKHPCFASDEAKAVFWDRFTHYAREFGFTPWVTTLMNNHYHVIGYLKMGANLPRMMQRFHGSVAKGVNDVMPSRLKEFWRDDKGREYFDGCIRDERQARLAYRYTLTRAVRARLVTSWEDYSGTRVNVESERAVARALKIGAFLTGVKYKRYLDARKPTR